MGVLGCRARERKTLEFYYPVNSNKGVSSTPAVPFNQMTLAVLLVEHRTKIMPGLFGLFGIISYYNKMTVTVLLVEHRTKITPGLFGLSI